MNPTLLLGRKELRAQAGLWLAVVGAMLAGLVPLPRGGVSGLGWLFYVVGVLALGANVMGHELRHGTLAQLFMQPVPRRRILAAKMAVLALLLSGAAAVAVSAIFHQSSWHTYPSDRPFTIAFFVLPLAYGFLVAPWLTLLSGNPLAGMLFSAALATLLLLGGTWLGTWQSDVALEIDAVRLRVLWTGSALLCVGGAIGLTRSFLHGQVAGGVGADITFPSVFGATRSTAARRRPRTLLLAAKELRLQQLTFVPPLIYVVVCLTLWTRRTSMREFTSAALVASVVHAVIVAALAGAFSCAGERALGTFAWQTLQPMAARTQFAIKAAVTIALAFALAYGLPVVVLPLLGVDIRLIWPDPSFGMLLVLLSGSMFLSSVSSNPVAAVFSCIPAFMATFWFSQQVAGRIGLIIWMALGWLHPLPRGYFIPVVRGWNAFAVEVFFALVLLAFAFENQRLVDGSPARTVRQVVLLAAALIIAAAIAGAAGRLLFP